MTDQAGDVRPPRVTRLSTTPIKGFALRHPTSIRLDANGAIGDRDFFLIDERHRLVSITKTGVFASWRADFDPEQDLLTLESGAGDRLRASIATAGPVVADFSGSRAVPGHIVAGPWADWLSDLAGRRLLLVRAKEAGEAFDEYPVTLVSDESIDALAPDNKLDPRRFRMLIGFAGVEPFAEESWRRRHLQVGSAVLRMGGPVPRCNATTRDPDTGMSDLRTLHLIKQVRGRQPNEFGDGLNLGVYAQVVEPGTISVGDQLMLGRWASPASGFSASG